MLVKQLYSLLFPGTAQPPRRQVQFWRSLSLAVALLFPLLALRFAFASEYVVQDDARQHVFWMRQYLDPNLLSTDLISSYFRSVAPIGYTTLYWLPAQVGIDPMVWNKLLPIGLSVITATFTFGISLQLFPVPFAAFLSTLLLNQNIWMKDDLVSATPRAFFYPLFVAFLYYLLKWKTGRSLWAAVPALIILALQGTFYPQVLLISAGVLILSLIDWESGRFKRSGDRRDYIFCAAGLVTTFLVLLPFALQTSEFDPLITVEQARQLPEFYEDGRTEFFVEPLKFWLIGERTGIFPQLWNPPLLLLGFLLPFIGKLSPRSPLLQRIQPTIQILPKVVVASLGLFALAHLLLFRLQHPSRYTQHSLRIVMALAAGITLAILIEKLLRWMSYSADAPTALEQSPSIARSASRARRKSAIAIPLLLLITVALAYPLFLDNSPFIRYKQGFAAELYQYFRQQPPDSLIASLSPEADNLPSFAQRPILASREYAIPFHLGYYGQLRQRMLDLLEAHYTPDAAILKNFIRQYGVDYLLLENGVFTENFVADNRWLMQFQPNADQAIATLQQQQVPALATFRRQCTVFQSPPFSVIDANCILSSPAQ